MLYKGNSHKKNPSFRLRKKIKFWQFTEVVVKAAMPLSNQRNAITTPIPRES